MRSAAVAGLGVGPKRLIEMPPTEERRLGHVGHR